MVPVPSRSWQVRDESEGRPSGGRQRIFCADGVVGAHNGNGRPVGGTQRARAGRAVPSAKASGLSGIVTTRGALVFFRAAGDVAFPLAPTPPSWKPTLRSSLLCGRDSSPPQLSPSLRLHFSGVFLAWCYTCWLGMATSSLSPAAHEGQAVPAFNPASQVVPGFRTTSTHRLPPPFIFVPAP